MTTDTLITVDCTYCAAHGVVTPAACRGVWVDADGTEADEWEYLCHPCLEASAYPPGYRILPPEV